jgi:WS/DGAT/MGAT family acyltransferase
MHKLSGIDATFLYMETNETPMHISSLLLCEPVKKGESPYEALKAQIAERIHEIPSFHRKLKHTPFYIDHPVWVEADRVDLDYHIKHAHLPKPGNLEQLRMIVQGLHSISLDRDRPLWQFYVIEGLEDPAFGLKKGSFALYTKAHHASIDGGAGVSAMDILSDAQATPRPPLPYNEISLSKESPGFFDLLGSAYGRFAQHQYNLLKTSPALVKSLRNVVKNSIEDGASLFDNLRPAPKTRFNVRIQKQRAFGAQSLPIKEVIGVAKQTGTTLNDVVLSICGGALQRYLDRHDELPKRSLVAAVPVSLREPGDKSGANQVASMNCAIGTDIDDPIERLMDVNRNSKKAKKSLAAIKDIFPKDYSFFGAPVMVTAMAQFTSRTTLVNHMPAAMNVAISNVPGSRKPMYFAGGKVIANFPVSIATHGCALNITLTSYVDRLDFGLVACKRAVPDVQDIADDLLVEFKLLQEAVAKKQNPKPKTAQKKTQKKIQA